MKTLSVLDASKTIKIICSDEPVSSKTISTIDVKSEISKKYRTFTRWNHKEHFKSKKKSSMIREDSPQQTNNILMLSALMKYTQELKNKSAQKNKNKLVIEELDGIKAERRERFKKVSNPLLLIQHYMKKENYKPGEEENYIMEKIIKLKEKIDFMHPFDLDFCLYRIYKIMNYAVDFNLLRFFVLLVVLAAQMCYQVKEMHRAFYFYNQAVNYIFYEEDSIKLQCLIQMAKIALQIQQYTPSINFFKKALQYAWKQKDFQSQLKIYDFIGQIYYYEGSVQLASYYHHRSIQGQVEKTNSAIKRISQEMLNEYEKKIKENCEKKNLSVLFIEYLDLPITNFQQIPKARVYRTYDNYKDGESPRKNRPSKSFKSDEFIRVDKQIATLLEIDEQFKSEIPDPDLHKNFVAEQKYGRMRKNLPFEKTVFYHKIVGIKPPSLHNEEAYNLPLEQKIEKKLSEKVNKNWWEDMIMDMKKKKQQKVGKLKDRIAKGHLSYHKYPDQRRRANSLKTQKIRETINKTLLNWIDPQK